jgi:hypothetical protein
VWENTHFFLALVAFAVTSGADIVLVFFVPLGMWQNVLIVGLFGVPTSLSILYFYLIEEDNTSTSSHDPHQLISLVTNETSLIYNFDFIHAQCNQSLVDRFSS